MSIFTRIINCVAAAVLAVAILPGGAAKADPGSNYYAAAQTDWVQANPNVMQWQWKPGTDYWKVELRLKCPSVYPAESSIDQVTSIIKGTSGPSWRAYQDSIDSYSDGPGVVDFDYPGGVGETGFHTPDYNGTFTFAALSDQFDENYGGTRCFYKYVFYNHDNCCIKHSAAHQQPVRLTGTAIYLHHIGPANDDPMESCSNCPEGSPDHYWLSPDKQVYQPWRVDAQVSCSTHDGWVWIQIRNSNTGNAFLDKELTHQDVWQLGNRTFQGQVYVEVYSFNCDFYEMWLSSDY